MLSDTNRLDKHVQLGYNAVLFIWNFSKKSPFHVLIRASRKSKRLALSIGSADAIAAAIAIDEGKLLAMAYSNLLRIEMKIMVRVDSKIYGTL